MLTLLTKRVRNWATLLLVAAYSLGKSSAASGEATSADKQDRAETKQLGS
jgi:hypothetical protein